MKSRIVTALLAAAVAAGAIAAQALAAEEPKLDDVKCPVAGKPAKAASAVEFEECQVYFCCNNCPKAFQANTEKFAPKARHQMVKTKQLKQKACPFSGRPTKEGTEVDVEGVTVAFCCNNCKGKAEAKSGDEQITLIFADTSKGFEKAEQ